jgi:L-fucose isomerase-like protein
MEITAFEPPRQCSVRHIGAIVRGDGIFAVEAVSPARSRMSWIDDVEPPLGALGRTAWRLVGERAFAFGARRSLARFAALVASGGTRTR